MKTNLATAPNPIEFTERTTPGRPFSLAPNVSPTSELYERTQEIHAWQPNIGYPSFNLTGIDGITHASITTGLDAEESAATWQILVRSDTEASILFARVTEAGERWQLITPDNQGRLWLQATMWDKETPGQLSSFVLDAISRVPNFDADAAILLENKLAVKTELDEHVAAQTAQERSGFHNKRLSQLASACAKIGYMSLGAIEPKNIIDPAKDRFCRWHNVERLPELVKTLLAATNYEVRVLRSKLPSEDKPVTETA